MTNVMGNTGDTTKKKDVSAKNKSEKNKSDY